MSYDPLIFGKGQLERIVAVEINDDVAEVYIEKEDGSIEVVFEPNKFWILSDEAWDIECSRLKGDLPYKFGKLYDNRQSWMSERSRLKKDYRDIFTIWNPVESFLVKTGHTFFKGMKVEDVSILSFDTETSGLKHNKDSEVYLISNTFRKNGKTIRKLFSVDEYSSPAKMIDAWCEWVRKMDPSIVSGYNIYSFDLPYLDYVASKYGTSLDLGRNGSKIQFESYDSDFRFDGSRDISYRQAYIYGRQIIDLLFVSIKYDAVERKYNSYKLKEIIRDEGLEDTNRVFYDASTIRENWKYPEERKKIKDYCQHDSDDAIKLYDLMIPSFFYFGQSIPKSFQSLMVSATGSQLNSLMIRSYLQQGHSLPKATDKSSFEGAISFGNPGVYSSVYKVDVSSLYPSIMIQYQVFSSKKDPNGHFLQVVKHFTEQRLHNKKLAKQTGNRHYKDLEQSQKIGINSLYGFCGSVGLLFNSPENAAFVTRKGREILTQAMNWAKSKDFIITSGDTDSIAFCKAEQTGFTKEERLSLLNELNSHYPVHIKFADDGYYPRMIVVKAKNYVMLTEDGKLKYKGSALRSPVLEPALREFLHRMVDAIINNKTNYVEIYNEYVKEINNVTDIKRWCTRKTLTEKVYESERANETKVLDAVEDTEYVEGDRIHVFYKPDETLELAENFTGEYNKERLYEKLYKTSQRFSTIMDTKKIFINYKLKRSKGLLEEVLNHVD